MNSKKQLLEKDPKFTPEELLREKRWNNGVTCPECLSTKINKNGTRLDGVQQYKCKRCNFSFNDRTNTVFSNTQMSVGECLKIIGWHREDKNISDISNKINRSWKTVNDFVKRLNQCLASSILLEMFESTEKTKLDYSKMGCGSSPSIN